MGFMAFTYYKQETIDEVVGEFDHLKKGIENSRFEIIEERDNTFLLKPKFDYPYSLFNGDMVYVNFKDEKIAVVEGPKYYVEGLIKDIRGNMNIITRLLSRTSIIILMFIAMIGPLIPLAGVEWDLRQMAHNLKFEVLSIDVIEIEDENALGNTLGNINNYGISTENEDYIFYVYDNMDIIRADKDFQNKVHLTENKDGQGIDYLNLVEDWIFYRKGGKFHRMNIDGSNIQTIYNMSHLLDVHIIGNWIYFINPEDDFKIYKMDINGQSLDRFLNMSVTDIAIFEDRLYFSLPILSEGYGKGRIESISLEGYDRRIELDTMASDITIQDGYFYYMNPRDQLYRAEMNSDKGPEILVNKRISSYIITNSGIFYTLHLSGQPDIIDGDGLYRIDFDRSNDELILDCEIFGHLSHVGDYVLFSSFDEHYYPHLNKLNIITNDVEIVQ